MVLRATLDLGTNTFHLLIAEVENGQIQSILVDEKRAVKIGAGGINQGYITDEAIQRAIVTFKEYKQIVDQYAVNDVVAIATSAFRCANNGLEVAEILYKESGIKIQIIDGEKEALLIHKGVMLAYNPLNNNALIVDIGGGSVEFVICNETTIHFKQSFEIGGLRMLELFQKSDPISIEDTQKLIDYLTEKLQSLQVAVNQFKPTIMLGASGAYDTMLEMVYAQYGLALTNAAAFQIDISDFKNLHQQLSTLSRAERLALPGMIPLRVDMIVVACILINYLIDNYQIGSLVNIRYALKEGAIVDDELFNVVEK